MAYEISVRGRQYDSVAAELNAGLLGDPITALLVRTAFGFTLDDIRAVRQAGAALMNERFFGARDRVGEAARPGADSAAIDAGSFRRDINLMLNECRLFGAVSAADVSARAGLPEGPAAAVLNFFSASRPLEDDPNTLDLLGRGQRPGPWGCISDNGEHLVLNGFLSEDELRRDIERRLIAEIAEGGNGSKVWAKYDKRRANFTETKAADAFSALLSGDSPRWRSQHYIGPISSADAPALGHDKIPTHRHWRVRVGSSIRR